jgi:hypothetical protein
VSLTSQYGNGSGNADADGNWSATLSLVGVPNALQTVAVPVAIEGGGLTTSRTVGVGILGLVCT